jgi:hypothetical protein
MVARTRLSVTWYILCLSCFKIYSLRFSTHFYTPIRALPSVCYPITIKFHRNPQVIWRWNFGTDEMLLTLSALQRAVKRIKNGVGFESHRPESRPLANINMWIFVGKCNFLPTRADLGSEPFKGLWLAASVQRSRHTRWIFFSLTSSMRIGFSLVVVVQFLLYSFGVFM